MPQKPKLLNPLSEGLEILDEHEIDSPVGLFFRLRKQEMPLVRGDCKADLEGTLQAREGNNPASVEVEKFDESRRPGEEHSFGSETEIEFSDGGQNLRFFAAL